MVGWVSPSCSRCVQSNGITTTYSTLDTHVSKRWWMLQYTGKLSAESHNCWFSLFNHLTSPCLEFFWVQVLPHFVWKPYVCRCRYPTSERVFLAGLWDAGWGWWENKPTFLCVGWYKKFHIGYQSNTICENKNVIYEAHHLCPIIVKAQWAPNAQATLQIVDRHYEEFPSPAALTIKPLRRPSNRYHLPDNIISDCAHI